MQYIFGHYLFKSYNIGKSILEILLQIERIIAKIKQGCSE